MARVNAVHVREYGALKELCSRGLDSATLRERVGDRLARHLGAQSYCFGATDPLTALPVHSVSVGLDRGAMDCFFGLVLTTPSLDFAPWVEAGRRVATLDELVDDVDTSGSCATGTTSAASRRCDVAEMPSPPMGGSLSSMPSSRRATNPIRPRSSTW